MTDGNAELGGVSLESRALGLRVTPGSHVKRQIGFPDLPGDDRGNPLGRIVDQAMMGQAPVLRIEFFGDRGESQQCRWSLTEV